MCGTGAVPPAPGRSPAASGTGSLFIRDPTAHDGRCGREAVGACAVRRGGDRGGHRDRRGGRHGSGRTYGGRLVSGDQPGDRCLVRAVRVADRPPASGQPDRLAVPGARPGTADQRRDGAARGRRRLAGLAGRCAAAADHRVPAGLAVGCRAVPAAGAATVPDRPSGVRAMAVAGVAHRPVRTGVRRGDEHRAVARPARLDAAVAGRAGAGGHRRGRRTQRGRAARFGGQPDRPVCAGRRHGPPATPVAAAGGHRRRRDQRAGSARRRQPPAAHHPADPGGGHRGDPAVPAVRHPPGGVPGGVVRAADRLCGGRLCRARRDPGPGVARGRRTPGRDPGRRVVVQPGPGAPAAPGRPGVLRRPCRPGTRRVAAR